MRVRLGPLGQRQCDQRGRNDARRVICIYIFAMLDQIELLLWNLETGCN